MTTTAAAFALLPVTPDVDYLRGRRRRCGCKRHASRNLICLAWVIHNQRAALPYVEPGTAPPLPQEFATSAPKTAMDVLGLLAEQVLQTGVRTVDGNVIGMILSS